MPPRKAGVPKQQQRGPSISTTAPTKHISSSSSKPGKSEISSKISNTSNKENNNKVAASITSH